MRAADHDNPGLLLGCSVNGISVMFCSPIFGSNVSSVYETLAFCARFQLLGAKNLRFKPSFFINSTDDNFSTSADAKKCEEAGCFEVVEGEGLVTDFCSEHFNKTTPLTALQNDFVTFSFIGGMDDENALVKADKIYFEGTAVASDGHRYTVNEKSDKTLMKRENQYTKTYNITFWPEGFFNVPEGTELVSIEYAFTNADGSISVTQSDDDFVMLNIPLPPQKEPFIYTFYCE